MQYNTKWFLALVSLIGLCFTPLLEADIVVDVDPVTPGIQSTYTVASGATFAIPIFYVPGVAIPGFDAVGLDLNWGGTATATPAGPGLLLGVIAAGAPVDDLVAPTAGPLPPGTPLASAGLPPSAPHPFSLGGAAHYDTLAGSYGFGGAPPPGPVDLMGQTFTITGSPGDTVTFVPSGIFAPGPSPLPGLGPFVPGGDALSITGSTTLPQPFFSGTITIAIPEPTTLSLLGGMSMLLLCLFRRQVTVQ